MRMIGPGQEASMEEIVERVRWSPHGSMPYERAETAIATLNGRIYLISGGSRGVEANAFNQEYDPATHAWSTAAPLINGAQRRRRVLSRRPHRLCRRRMQGRPGERHLMRN